MALCATYRHKSFCINLQPQWQAKRKDVRQIPRFIVGTSTSQKYTRAKNTEIKKQPAQGIDPKEVAKQAKIKQSDNRFDTFDKQWLRHPFHKKTV